MVFNFVFMTLKVDVKSALSAILIGHVGMTKDVSKLFDAIGNRLNFIHVKHTRRIAV